MKFLRDKFGQVAVMQVIGWGASIVVALSTFFWSSLASTDIQVDNIKLRQTAIVERVAKLEEAVSTIKTDTGEIKGDIKSILQKLK